MNVIVIMVFSSNCNRCKDDCPRSLFSAHILEGSWITQKTSISVKIAIASLKRSSFLECMRVRAKHKLCIIILSSTDVTNSISHLWTLPLVTSKYYVTYLSRKFLGSPKHDIVTYLTMVTNASA